MIRIEALTDCLPPRVKSFGVVVLIVLLIALCFHLHGQLITKPKQAALHSAINSVLNDLTSHVNQYIEQQQRQLDQLAADPSALESLTSEQARIEFQNLVTNQLLNAELSLIVPADQTNNKVLPNFVALDMARRTLKGEPTPPEALKYEGKWRLLIASPILNSNNDMPIATLLTSLAVEPVKKSLISISAQQGRMRLLQQLPNTQQQAVFAAGSGNRSEYTANHPSNVDHWRVEFTPSEAMIKAQQAPLLNQVILYTLIGLEAFLLSWFIFNLMVKARKQMAIRAEAKQQKFEREQARLAKATSFLSESSDNDVIKKKLAAYQQELDEKKSNDKTPTTDNENDVFDLSNSDNQERGERPSKTPEPFSATVFRAYDIRGVYGNAINEHFAKELGRALGTVAQQKNEQRMVVAHDGRTSSPSLYEALVAGILETGCDVYALGLAPTPLTNFAINHLEDTSSGVTVTASHNPPEYNGFKMSIAGIPLTPDEITQLRSLMIDQQFVVGCGTRHELSVSDAYIDHVGNDTLPANGLHVVLDASNGAAGPLASQLLERIGCKLTTLYCDVDGNFPNHLPDTSVASNLNDLISVVQAQNADLGIALDGDGDRIVAVSGNGTIVWPDELMMIFSRDVLARTPGADIVFDIKSTRRLGSMIGNYGGRPIMWKTGHSHIREKIRELNAPLGGEYSGHLFFNDRWFGFDDGIYSAVRLIEIINLREQSLQDMLGTLPTCQSSNELRIEVPEKRKFELIEQLIANGDFKDAKLTTLDGLRIDLAHSWGLVRASNTTPALTLRFEGDTADDLALARDLIKQQLQAIAPDIDIDF